MTGWTFGFETSPGGNRDVLRTGDGTDMFHSNDNKRKVD